jgi:2-oxoisovalerate dehydrogenase E1 component
VTRDFEGLIAEVMGRTSGASGGYGGSQHLRKTRFYSNGIQGGMTPIAVGLAHALKEESTRNLCVCFIGDGTLGEGVVYEAFNLAAKWQVPVLFAIEDNGYAQSSSKRQTLAGSIAGRAAAFGIRYFEANIVDVPGLDEACGAATRYIRGELQPAIVHVHTMRLNSHSKGDDNRDCGEIQAHFVNVTSSIATVRLVSWTISRHRASNRSWSRLSGGRGHLSPSSTSTAIALFTTLRSRLGP